MNIPDWESLIYYTNGDVVFASDDIAYIAVTHYESHPFYHEVINLSLDPVNLIGWEVWKRLKNDK